ncbi:MAG: hypothetical protein HC906_07145, partial [Bacteroidales bacterium]|nr:hypothetical protein [Bacteroidales bacterium]
MGKPLEFTRFEHLAILSIYDALAKTEVDVKSSKTLLIVSTTKGNIDLLEKRQTKKVMNLQAVILTEATTQTGLGHLSRCMALQAAFEQVGTTCQIWLNSDAAVK